MKNLKNFLHGALVPIILLILWEAGSRFGLFSEVLLPSPTAVAIKWWAYLLPLQPQEAGQSYLAWLVSGEMLHDAYSSLFRVVAGFLIGAALALPLGLLMGASPRIYELFNPLMQILRPIPPIAYIPLAILWFGLGNPPSFFLIAIGAFFPVLMNTIAGVRQVDGILSARGAQPRRQSMDDVHARHPARRDALHPWPACASASALPSSW